MKDVRTNTINATEEVVESIRTIMLNQAESFAEQAQAYYKDYVEYVDEEEKKRKGDMFSCMYAKVCACYNNMKALGIISEKEEYMLIIEAFDKAAGTSLLKTVMSK